MDYGSILSGEKELTVTQVAIHSRERKTKIVTLAQFKDSLKESAPPEVSQLLRAMWYDGKGSWNQAHDIAQEIHSNEGSWIHAYLHRKEGDLSNAQYWYYKAKRKMPSYPLDQEWEELVKVFIEKNN